VASYNRIIDNRQTSVRLEKSFAMTTAAGQLVLGRLNKALVIRDKTVILFQEYRHAGLPSYRGAEVLQLDPVLKSIELNNTFRASCILHHCKYIGSSCNQLTGDHNGSVYLNNSHIKH